MKQWVRFRRAGEKQKHGIFVRWDGDFAVILRGAGTQVRIHKYLLVFEEEEGE